VCWNCGTSLAGVEDRSFQPVTATDSLSRDAAPGGTAHPAVNPIACSRCDLALTYVGRKRFHEGTNWGVLGEIGEFFVKREHFDVYVCPRCGRVELFVDGIGEEQRPY
jgi:hypothetical protein